MPVFDPTKTVLAFRFLFPIFAIMMLPFAIPLLSARLRARMGLKWVVVTMVALLVVIPASLALIAPSLLESHYEQLQHESTKFYVRLGAACDQLLAQHPPGTNEIVSIPVTDPSLPQAIKEMHPIKLHVNQDGVWMLLDFESRNGIGLTWGPKTDDTNIWVMGIHGEGGNAEIFLSNRNFMPGVSTQPAGKTR